LPYLDDLAFFISGSKEHALRAQAIIEEALRDAGLIRKASKGVWEPTQCLPDHLGMCINSVTGTFSAPSRRLCATAFSAGQGSSLPRCSLMPPRFVCSPSLVRRNGHQPVSCSSICAFPSALGVRGPRLLSALQHFVSASFDGSGLVGLAPRSARRERHAHLAAQHVTYSMVRRFWLDRVGCTTQVERQDASRLWPVEARSRARSPHHVEGASDASPVLNSLAPGSAGPARATVGRQHACCAHRHQRHVT
jgi:hypothetical protein